MADLWAGTAIPVFGVAGEFSSGKTLEILSIDPEHTKLYDMELSAKSYNLPLAERVDVPATMLKSHPAGYKPIDMWLWFLADLKKIKPGQFTVIAVDPVSDIEAGLVDWVVANPQYFGRSPDQYKKSGGILWGDVKAYWKVILADLAVRCDTFAFSVHMRDQFFGASPTGKREPKGKDTLMELSSLFLLLERKADAKGIVPEKPSANVLKSRLAHTKWVDGELQIVSILPPRLPVATPGAIREYIKRPADYAKLGKGERLEVHVQSEEEVVAAKTILADKMLAIEQAKTENLRVAEAAQMRIAKAVEDKLLATKPASDQTAKAVEQKEAQAEVRGEAAKTVEEIGTVHQNGDTEQFPELTESISKIRSIATSLNISEEQLQGIAAKRGANRLEDLTLLQAEEIRSKLYTKLTAADMQAAAEGKVVGQ